MLLGQSCTGCFFVGFVYLIHWSIDGKAKKKMPKTTIDEDILIMLRYIDIESFVEDNHPPKTKTGVLIFSNPDNAC